MTALPKSTAPILCAHLIRKVDQRLIELMRTLTASEWSLPTVAPGWSVRDVAAHLLDTAVRKLSQVRDHHFVETFAIASPQDLVSLINRLNHEGVIVYRRLSPPVLIQFMELACAESTRFHEALDPFGPATFAVSWAGEHQSLNWFDTARELTERWHHQQQIRLAANRPGIMTPELYHPVLDCFLRGVPHLYRDVEAPPGTAIVLEIVGDCGGQWCLRRHRSGWYFDSAATRDAASRVRIPQELAWLIFTQAINPKVAEAQVEILGNYDLGKRVLNLTGVVR